MSFPKRLGWVKAIEMILEDADHPLPADQIAQIALNRELVRDATPWPDQSVKWAICRHIRDKKNAVGFVTLCRNHLTYYWLLRKSQFFYVSEQGIAAYPCENTLG